VAVARALVVEPEILLLDEPLSNLDANLREEMRFEIRRLHEAFGITTLYVTHDQAEAMVISDRIAVLYRGRVVQIGAAQQLFEQPRTRFVADFIGKTNLVDGLAAAPDRLTRGGLSLRAASASLKPGAAATVSIRPHAITLAPASSPRPEGEAVNVLRGIVQRTSYLGDAIDYQVQVEGSDVVLRVAGPPPAAVRAGQQVTLAFPAAACVPLADGD
jgi:iron(III) transport system ATP-binding protein